MSLVGECMIIVEELAQLARFSPERLKRYKADGLKIIGYTGRFVPEELISASGAIPYLICRGGEAEPPDAVSPYMVRFMSPFARTQIGYQLLSIDPVIPMLDLIVAQCDDCHMTRLADLLEYFKLPTHRLGIPSDWKKSLSRDYYHKGVVRLKEKLEDVTGNKITDDILREAINSLNEIRELLQKISLLRKIQPPPIGGYDFIKLTHYSFNSELPELIRKLEDLYEQLQNINSPFSAKAPRILLAGHVVAFGDYTVPKLVEDSRGVVVGEFMDEGTRHLSWRVSTDGDLLNNLVQTYYLKRCPPSVFQPSWEERSDFIKKLVEELTIDGVIWYQLSFEEIYDMESCIIAKAMGEKSVPFLKLETSYEYARESMGPLVTRIESFIESIRGRRS